jgi:hypothetical protein
LAKSKLFVADLTNADLSDTDLTKTHLLGANLERADLTGADLTGAHLHGADLSSADVASADFDFDSDSPAKVVPGIYTARHLQLVTFYESPAGLVKLRGEFKELGMRTQEALVTYAIRRSELNRRKIPGYHYGPYVHGRLERAMTTMFFDWTCQYGMSPPAQLSSAEITRLTGNELNCDQFEGGDRNPGASVHDEILPALA